jgi:hypothetical protein
VHDSGETKINETHHTGGLSTLPDQFCKHAPLVLRLLHLLDLWVQFLPL